MNTQKQQSYETLHNNKKKFSSGDKESYISFLEEQLKKLTDTLVDNDQIKERLEEMENKMERIVEKTDKFQKINKLLQTCVDNQQQISIDFVNKQEEDLKTFKDKIYLDIDMKCKVIESKFDVDDKLESNLNKKFNQRQRDFEKLTENFDKKIQANYEEFSSEIAIDLKQIENKVEERVSQLKDELLYWMKGEIEGQQRDRQIYTHFQEFRSGVNDQFELQKTELNAYFELLNTKTRTSFNDFSQKIEERLQRYEYNQQEQHINREDDREQQKQKKDVSDLKYISNLIMEKVEKLEKISQKSTLPVQQSVEFQKNMSFDKIELKLANQMSGQFEKLSNIIKQLQDQQFSIEKKIMKIDPRNTDNIKASPKKQEESYERRIEQDRKYDQIIEHEEMINNAATIKHQQNHHHSRNNSNSNNHNSNNSRSNDKTNHLSDKYSLISEKLKQRRIQDEEESQQLQQQQFQQQQHYQQQPQFEEIQKQQFVSRQYERDSSHESNSPSKDHIKNKGRKEIDKSQNTDSLNQSIDEVLSKRKNILTQKPPSGINQFSSPQSNFTQPNRLNSAAAVYSSNNQERSSKYSNLIEKDNFTTDQLSNQNELQRQNIFDSRNQLQKQPIPNDSYKRRSFDERLIMNTEPSTATFNVPIQKSEEYEEQTYCQTEQKEQIQPQSRMQKSSSMNRFEEIQQRNIQNSPTNQVDENLADHLEQRRERLRKFIKQTEQQLEDANSEFEEQVNRKYDSMKDQQKSASSSYVGDQQFKSLPQKNSENSKFSPFSNEKNQFRGEGIYSKQFSNKHDMSDTFTEEQKSEEKNKYNFNRKEEYDHQPDETTFDEDQFDVNYSHVNNKGNNKNNQIFSVGDDSDIMRLNHRINTVENNTDSFSRDVVSRSQSREIPSKQNNNFVIPNSFKNKYEKQENKELQQQQLSNISEQKQKNQPQQSIRSNKVMMEQSDDSDEEEIQKVLQKYNNTKVNINDLIQKKKEEEKQRKAQQQQKQLYENVSSPTNKIPYIERETPQSSSKKLSNHSGQKAEYGGIGNKTRDLLRDDDDTSYDISTSQINQSEFTQNILKSNPKDIKNQFSKPHKSVTQRNDQKPQKKQIDQNNKQQSVTSSANHPSSSQKGESQKDLESFFYTKGLKYDFNFSTNTSKTKDQSKSFSLIDKVMNNSSKQKK